MKRSLDSQIQETSTEDDLPRKLHRSDPVVGAQNILGNRENSENSEGDKEGNEDNEGQSSDSESESESESSTTTSPAKLLLNAYLETLREKSTFSPSETESEIIRNTFSMILGANIKDFTMIYENDDGGRTEYRACLGSSNRYVNVNGISYVSNVTVCLRVYETDTYVSVSYQIPQLKTTGELNMYWMTQRDDENDDEDTYLRKRTIMVYKDVSVRNWLLFSRTETLKYMELSPELHEDTGNVKNHLNRILFS